MMDQNAWEPFKDKEGKAFMMAPSIGGVSNEGDFAPVVVEGNGSISGNSSISAGIFGYRPIIILSTDTQLIDNGDGTYSIK